MSKIDPTQAEPTSNKQPPNTLPVIKRIRLPQRLRDDGWWLCPTPPQRPSGRVLRFPQRLTLAGRSERARHD